MAVSTHRWRPEVGVKSGYSWNRKNKKPRHYKKSNCLIELKFENSSYFVGVKNPISSIYKVNEVNEEVAPVYLDKLESSKVSEMSALSNIDQRLTKKLYVSEYVQGKNVYSLTKLTDPFVRGYIISSDKAFLEEAHGILELVKIKFATETWNSFRMIIIPKSSDISSEILRNAAADKPKYVVKNLEQKLTEEIGEDDEERIDEGPEMYTDDESKSTNTTMDEDAEEKLRNKVAASKFRDSRIILANRPKSLKPEIDPVEKCFLALTKLFEDNIFSAAKGLSELNLEIGNMLKPSFEDLAEKTSNDSIDINFQL